MDARWVKILSWHIIKRNPFGNAYLTLCHRVAAGITRDTLPQGEKSCETCLRIFAKAA